MGIDGRRDGRAVLTLNIENVVAFVCNFCVVCCLLCFFFSEESSANDGFFEDSGEFNENVFNGKFDFSEKKIDM